MIRTMPKRAKIFWTGRSQAVRLPREFRFDADEVLVRRRGRSVILDPLQAWPHGYADSFSGVTDLERPPQGAAERRRRMR